MPRVTRTDQADLDIAAIMLRLYRHSLPAADRVAEEIEDACDMLARSPGLGRARGDLGPDLRSHATRDGYIVYFLPTADGIEVQRVLHGSRKVDPSMF